MTEPQDIPLEPARASTFRDPAEWLVHSFGGRKTTSGVRVTTDTSLSLSVYFACIRNISEDIAKLPFKVHEPLASGGKQVVADHPVGHLLNISPNAEQTAMSFRTLLTHWALGWGGGVAAIHLDGGGNPAALWPIHPDRITLHRDKETGELQYEVRSEPDSPAPETVVLRSHEVLHIHGLGGGTGGYSVVEYASDSIGLGLAAQRFGASFFGNNAAIGGILQHPEKLSDKAYSHLRQSFSNTHSGPDNAGKTAILEEGMTYHSKTIPNDQAQFIESRKFQIPEICRWFRMPPHKVQDLERSTFSNIEQQSIEYVTDALMPWAIRWEQEVDRKLLSDRMTGMAGDVFSKHAFQGLLRGDQAARAAFYGALFQIGAMSPDDIRALEDMNPIDGGDKYFIPMNMQTVDSAADPPPPAPAPRPFPPDDDDIDDEEEADESEAESRSKRSLAPLFADAAERVVCREVRAATRARNKRGDGWSEWADRFYASHRDVVQAAFDAPADALASLILGGSIGVAYRAAIANAIQSVAEGHIEESRREIDSSHERGCLQDSVSYWSASAAPALADKMLEATMGAIK